MFYLQCLDWALAWKFISLFLSIALERFGEEMKFDITPAGTSVYKSKSGQERKEEEPTNSRFDDRLKQVLPFWLLSGTL